MKAKICKTCKIKEIDSPKPFRLCDMCNNTFCYLHNKEHFYEEMMK